MTHASHPRDQLRALLVDIQRLAKMPVAERDLELMPWRNIAATPEAHARYAPFLAALESTATTGTIPEITDTIAQAYMAFMDDAMEEMPMVSPHREAAVLRWLAQRDRFDPQRSRAFLEQHVLPKLPLGLREGVPLGPHLLDHLQLVRMVDAMSICLMRARREQYGKHPFVLVLDRAGNCSYDRDQSHDPFPECIASDVIVRTVTEALRMSTTVGLVAIRWIANAARHVPDLFPDWTSTIIDEERIRLVDRAPRRRPNHLPQE